jgi:hypothetical protein
MFRCPTCIAVLAEPRARRCDTCGQNLRRRHPLVLGDADKLNAHRLPIDRFMAKQAKLHLPPALRSVPPVPAVAPTTTAAPPPAPPAPDAPKRAPRRLPVPKAAPTTVAAPVARTIPPEPVVAAAPSAPPAPATVPIVDDLMPDRRLQRGRGRRVDVDGLAAFVPAVHPRPAVTPKPMVTAPVPVFAAPMAKPEPVKSVALFDLAECEASEAKEANAIGAVEPIVMASPLVLAEPVVAPEPVAATPVVAAEPEPVVAVKPVNERRQAVASQPAAPEDVTSEFQNPALHMIERYTLAVARQPVREIDPDIEAALDDLARTAREEILAKNGPKKPRHDPDTPWLAPIRKAWEPPDPEELAPRPSRWAFRRRAG